MWFRFRGDDFGDLPPLSAIRTGHAKARQDREPPSAAAFTLSVDGRERRPPMLPMPNLAGRSAPARLTASPANPFSPSALALQSARVSLYGVRRQLSSRSDAAPDWSGREPDNRSVAFDSIAIGAAARLRTRLGRSPFLDCLETRKELRGNLSWAREWSEFRRDGSARPGRRAPFESAHRSY